ncbi:MAG TPA: type II secretion system protein GspM [Nitriliruptorales bacterium]|nr:type II secretion system protein GspM [Nitriliruptorales bacterium]
MNRRLALISAGVAVVLVLLFYFLGWRPQSEEIAELDDQREQVEAETERLEARVRELERVQADAPAVEAAIVAADSIVPRDLALPSALRQLQLAADESGATLVTVSVPSRPEPADGAPGLASIPLNLQATGGYFQLVDFLRRVEDPAISPRGIVWESMNVTGAPDDYPTLTANVTGRMYAVLPVPPEPAPSPSPGATPEGDAATPAEGGASPTPQETSP